MTNESVWARMAQWRVVRRPLLHCSTATRQIKPENTKLGHMAGDHTASAKDAADAAKHTTNNVVADDTSDAPLSLPSLPLPSSSGHGSAGKSAPWFASVYVTFGELRKSSGSDAPRLTPILTRARTCTAAPRTLARRIVPAGIRCQCQCSSECLGCLAP